MAKDDESIQIRPSRIKNPRTKEPSGVINQVLRAANKAGHVSHMARVGKGPSTFGRGRAAFSRARLFSSSRNVAVKARIVRQSGKSFRSAPMATHILYLKRDGVSKNDERAVMFDAHDDHADVRAFIDRCEDDRHHFRFIISPEEAAEMSDLRSFTRDLAQQMAHDLGTKLDWVAVDHWNTDNPHVHLLLRGVDDSGADLVISRDYIGHGLRSRAQELVARELGPKPEHEIRLSLARDVEAERWTRLDSEIKSQTNDLGFIDLRPEHPGLQDPILRRQMIGRLQRLEQMGLATNTGPGTWLIESDAPSRLRDLGLRGDIIKTMHRRLNERGVARPFTDYNIYQGKAASPIIGRLIATGLHDELSGEAYALIDGIDGRAHHIRFKDVEAFEHAPTFGGVVEVRRFGSEAERTPTLVLAHRSDQDITQQITAPGATWLDHRLVAREPMALSTKGFGAEVSHALEARMEFHVAEGFAQLQGGRIILQRNLLETLRQRELDRVGEKLSQELGLAHKSVHSGFPITGIYRQQLQLTSGRYAMIENGLGFQLVPWTPSLEKKLGQEISGITRSNGGIDWSLGRGRGLEI